MPKPTRWAEFLRLAALETDECVIWPHNKNVNGYPRLNFRAGEMTCSFLLHREALMMRTPLLSPGLFACHAPGIGCSRACINYRHLRWDDSAGNYADSLIDGTSSRGTRCGTAKLDEQKVREIRALASAGVGRADLVERFKVTSSAIYGVVMRRNWGWVE